MVVPGIAVSTTESTGLLLRKCGRRVLSAHPPNSLEDVVLIFSFERRMGFARFRIAASGALQRIRGAQTMVELRRVRK